MELVPLHTLFNIEYGNSYEFINLETCTKDDQDSVAFVSRTMLNNGVSGFVKEIENVKPFQKGLITVSVGGSVLETFLQQENFIQDFI
ncbi:MAG: hypothetical protein IPP48_06180 [Chitinophagaceae bacterium]|nr:hypothetical protein [Chitinophagaceae bacterium]